MECNGYNKNLSIEYRMKKVFGLNFFLFSLIALILVFYFSKQARDEGFGMAPGVMDQLSSTRVETEEDEDIDNKIYDNLTRQGIINMTESG